MSSEDRIDALLREFHRPEAAPKQSFAGIGRKLQDNGPRVGGAPAATSADVDTSMAWMEQRVRQLDVLTSEAHQSQQREPQRMSKPAGSSAATPRAGADNGGVAELASLERGLREATGRLLAVRTRVMAARAQLEAVGVDANAVASSETAPVPAVAAPRAAMPVRPAVPPGRGGGRGGAAGGSTAPTASELREATSRRAALVRKQLPAVREQLEAAEREAAELGELLRAAGLQAAVDEAAIAEGTSAGSPHPAALYAQLVHLDRAHRATLAVADALPTRLGGGVHSLVEGGAPKIPLTVFADGFMLYRGPFRPFGSEEARGFAEQAMSGFLPHELQQRHPEGFALELHDRSAETHANAHAEARARVAAAAGIAGVADLEATHSLLAPQRAEQLLRNLPEAVVRDGGLVPVRSEVAAMLGAAPAARGPMQQRHDAQAVREARLKRFGS